MRVAIVGSRGWADIDAIKRYIDGLPADTVIISGGAAGVDTFAEEFASKRGLEVKIYYPDWNTHGRSAGMIRNGEIVADSDVVVAFWDGLSKGTRNTIDRALNAPHIRGVRIEKKTAE